MKKLLLFTAGLTLLFASCKKNDDNTGLGNNQFRIESTTYSDVYLSNSWGMLSAISPTGGALQMSFFDDILPASNGTFKVTYDLNAADQIQIIASGNFNGTTKSYVAGLTAGQTATVSVSNGNYTVKFNNVSARNINDSTETVLVSANVSQN